MPNSLSFELALVLLLAAIVAVPLFRKLGLVAVLAYLATGVLLGPDGIGVVRDPLRLEGAPASALAFSAHCGVGPATTLTVILFAAPNACAASFIAGAGPPGP